MGDRQTESRGEHRQPIARGVVREVANALHAVEQARLERERAGEHDRQRGEHEPAAPERQHA